MSTNELILSEPFVHNLLRLTDLNHVAINCHSYIVQAIIIKKALQMNQQHRHKFVQH